MRELPLVLLIALSVSTISARACAQDTRPNIVILLADDMGVGDLGCYGQARIETPHIDALARDGVLARYAYAAAPVCAPSRCSLLTGLHAGHCTVDHNDEPNLPLGLGDPTIADVLAREGYRTALVGKWGLGGETDHGEPFTLASLPSTFGFEHVLAVLDQERAQDHFPDRVWAGEGWRVIPENADGAHGVWDADVFADDALAFIDAHDTRPFFLYFASTLPHRELDPPTLAHADTDWPEAERAYATMVERFDADVGRIVERLDALDRSTIVIVASDNGPVDVDGHTVAFFDSTAGLRGQKRDLYEGGLRVPLIVHWRGTLSPREITTPVALYDLFPTLVSLVHAEAPSSLDGVAIDAWLRGERADAAHESLFFSVHEARTAVSIRRGAWVAIQREDAVELYDLGVDPDQHEDVAAAHAAEARALLDAAAAQQSGPIRRSFPILRFGGDGVLLPAVDPRTFTTALELGMSSRDPLVLEGVGDAPRSLVTAHGGHAEDDAIALASGDYLTLPAQPALSFGDESFTLQARVRLDHVMQDAHGREARRYLALSKPTGSPDELLDWGVMVQTGDLTPAGTGHELAILFADPEIGGHGTWTIATHDLAITDDRWHSLVFRFDAAARRATIGLDDAREEFAVDDLGHVRSDGPLVIGAHHDLRGTFDGFLDGAIASFRLDRGVVPDAMLGQDTREPTHDFELALGEIPIGSEAITRTIWIENAGASPTMAMDVEGDVTTSDDRVHVELTPVRTLTSRTPITVRIDPSRVGAFSASVAIVATISHYGIRVRGPIGFSVTGEVTTPPTEAPFPWTAVALAVVVAIALVIAGLRRSESRRA